MERLDFKFHNLEFPALLLPSGEWIFNGNLVCEECGLVKNQNHVARYIKNTIPSKWFTEFNPEEIGRPGLYLYEAGLYFLIFQGVTEGAFIFRDFVLETVLPSIRKQGIYIEETRFSTEEKEKLEAIVSERDSRIQALEAESLAIKMAFDDSIRESKAVKKNLEIKLASEIENNHVFATEAELQLNARTRSEKELLEARQKLTAVANRYGGGDGAFYLEPENPQKEYHDLPERFRRMIDVFYITQRELEKAKDSVLKRKLKTEFKRYGF